MFAVSQNIELFTSEQKVEVRGIEPQTGNFFFDLGLIVIETSAYNPFEP